MSVTEINESGKVLLTGKKKRKCVLGRITRVYKFFIRDISHVTTTFIICKRKSTVADCTKCTSH